MTALFGVNLVAVRNRRQRKDRDPAGADRTGRTGLPARPGLAILLPLALALALGTWFGCVPPPPPPPPPIDIDTNGVVGLVLAGGPGEFPVILAVAPGSPAALDREIAPGDEIISLYEVDATADTPGARVIPSTREVPFAETLLMMRGTPGSLVAIKARRRGAGDFSEVGRLKVWARPAYYETTLRRVPASSLKPPLEGTSRVMSVELRGERLVHVQPPGSGPVK